MIPLRFLGPWPAAAGIAAALALAVAAARFYARRLRGGPATRIRRALPWLRGAAVFFLVLMLTGPVLRHRRVIGELARVAIVVDASRSMELADPQMEDDRRALLAHRLGRLAPGALDEAAYAAAAGLRAAAESAAAYEAAPPGGVEAARRRGEFAAAVAAAHDALGRARAATLEAARPPGRAYYERWDGVPGSALADLANAPAFAGPPSDLVPLEQLTYRPAGLDAYGGRIRGFLHPPATGAYLFWIAGDDQCELRLSTNETPELARRIAHVETWTPPEQWGAQPSQRSERIALRAGRRYYFEILHKESIGDDSVAVGWRRPDGATERPIPASYVSTLLDPGALQPRALFEQNLAAPARAAAAAAPDAPGAAPARVGALGRDAAAWATGLRAALAQAAREAAAAGDTAASAAIETTGREPRWERVRELLLGGPRPLLRRLAARHEIELYALRGDTLDPLWRSPTGEPPGGLADLLPPRPDGVLTDLALALRAGAPSAGAADRARAVVVLSDGVHNAETAPLETARTLHAQGVPVFTVLVGSEQPRPDLSIAGIEAPGTVHHQDRVRGHLELSDTLPAGQPFRVVAACDGEVLWEREEQTAGAGRRRVPFDFPVEAAAAAKRDRAAGLDRRGVPLAIEFRVEPPADDADPRNNRRVHRVFAMTRENRVLLIDDRPRWEWRYLHNLFERDPTWRADLVLPGADGAMPRGPGANRLPGDRDALFAYDLVVLGDVAPDRFTAEELEALREFVGTRGGGLVLIDGPRGHLAGYAGGPLDPLWPVDVDRAAERVDVSALRPTAAGAAIAAFDLGPDDEQPDTPAWARLPPPRWIAAATVRPGAETLVEAQAGAAARPAVALRRYGAGRVLYFAFDETWRWRYRVEDRHHRRFWNQVSLWMMEAPFAVGSATASLDADAIDYPADARARLRARLRDAQGRPRTDAVAWIELYHEGRRAAMAPLTPEAGGVYRGETEPLTSGAWEARIRVLDEPGADPPVAVEFSVRSAEENEWIALEADGERLRRLAAAGGGAAFREEEIDALADALEPLSRGRVIESDTLLWQGYGWLALVSALLTLEWILRKREGMS